MSFDLLRDYLPRHTYGVAAAYRHDALLVAIAGVRLTEDGLLLQFPDAHGFEPGDRITVHLDNRMDVSRYTDQLPVHRVSYKGVVTDVTEGSAEVGPVQYQVFHSYRCVAEYGASGFSFPPDERRPADLPESPLTRVPVLRDDEAGSHLGVFVTRAPLWPHTTVMAFLSSDDGDIFLITDPSSFKGNNVFRDPRGVFAVDFRATYDLEKPMSWAYRLRPVEVHGISRQSPLFEAIRNRFLEKNPWEGAFFAAPTSVLLHLKPT